eukprot:63463-Pelagomonas_calceolata.AAC.5
MKANRGTQEWLCQLFSSSFLFVGNTERKGGRFHLNSLIIPNPTTLKVKIHEDPVGPVAFDMIAEWHLVAIQGKRTLPQPISSAWYPHGPHKSNISRNG